MKFQYLVKKGAPILVYDSKQHLLLPGVMGKSRITTRDFLASLADAQDDQSDSNYLYLEYAGKYLTVQRAYATFANKGRL